jgi:hypothetical protein
MKEELLKALMSIKLHEVDKLYSLLQEIRRRKDAGNGEL